MFEMIVGFVIGIIFCLVWWGVAQAVSLTKEHDL